jgi:hypothetical protein
MERYGGAPRDFRDIFTLCQVGLTTPSECWHLWRERQRLAESDASDNRARLAVETHLARIAKQRPLEKITNVGERAEAKKLRAWFEMEFLDALMD